MEQVNNDGSLQTNGGMLTTVSEELKRVLMPMIAEGFYGIPPGVAKQAVRIMSSKGWSVEKCVSVLDKAMLEFIPQYGVQYPSVAFLLGKRNATSEEDNGYLIDGKPFDQVYELC